MDQPALADALVDADKVLRTFLAPDGSLRQIPAKANKRLVVLNHIAQSFEPGEHYTETQVNNILRGFHPDVASVRRYLIDAQFLDRGDGVYWRCGGTTDI